MEEIQIGKEEVKLSLFVDGMSLYPENFNNVARRLPELLKKFIKVAETQVIFRNLLHVYALTMNYQKERRNNPINHCIKKNKRARNKPT